MNTFFAGANSESGFINLFSEILKPYKRCYILKGGCGCGKSSFMKKLAAEGERRAEAVKRIYCASDSSSLDGVLLPERSVAIVDGTAPHTAEAKNAGACDITVDLGEYLDVRRLREHSVQIVSLAKQKSQSYSQAYSLLSAVGSVRRCMEDLLSTALQREKLLAMSRRFAKKHAFGGAPVLHRLYRKAFNSEGICESCAVTDGIAFYDRYGVCDSFLRGLAAFCGGELYVTPDPIHHELWDGLLLADGCFVYRSHEKTDSCINGERFIDRRALAAVRGRLRFLGKLKQSLTDAARELLAQARGYHEELEKLYTPSVDFTKVDARLEQVMADIFS